jgi:hypothetical protein
VPNKLPIPDELAGVLDPAEGAGAAPKLGVEEKDGTLGALLPAPPMEILRLWPGAAPNKPAMPLSGLLAGVVDDEELGAAGTLNPKSGLGSSEAEEAGVVAVGAAKDTAAAAGWSAGLEALAAPPREKPKFGAADLSKHM